MFITEITSSTNMKVDNVMLQMLLGEIAAVIKSQLNRKLIDGTVLSHRIIKCYL